MDERKLAGVLGWFSIGLGLAEVVAARSLGRFLGAENRSRLVRLFGAREIATGVGILSRERRAPWLWARVGGDVLDLAALCSALAADNRKKGRVAFAAAAVAAVTALDIYCGRSLGSGEG
jgi:hypothetical protein